MSYSIETDRKWQARWETLGLNTFDPQAPGEKLYCLEMFSYPSGAQLHVGHWYNYALTDTWARFKKMQGYNVFQPMGFDAFGLPAENYAIKTGIHPQDSTLQNIETMEKQLRELGGMFSWDHELATCLPNYYKWTQWLFLKLFEKGLAYRKNAPVNWCPSCQTVLANEQVKEGCCDRCGSEVTHKQLTQWFFKITEYAQELLDGLQDLDWPEKTKKIQTNWIGRSEGTQVHFDLVDEADQPLLDEAGNPRHLTVFTTRVDTLMGVTYVVVAPEAEITPHLLTPAQTAEATAYIEATQKASEIDRQATDRPKTGVFTGAYVRHPIHGKRLPVWLSDYVLASYGTGAVMAVPAHDERDYAFASTYGLPIQPVITPSTEASKDCLHDLPYTGSGVLVHSGEWDGLDTQTARETLTAALESRGLGARTINYRLRDWLVSRQRYWGAPIPVIHCDHCGIVPVPEADLPVQLPYDVEFKPDGQSPLATCEAFVNTTCPCCGRPARRDVDTLDTFVCSSWYYLRYIDPHNEKQAFDPQLADRLLPVDKYVGGAEHAAMHLLYARFITKALRDLGYLNFDEPFRSLVHQGTILGSDGQKMSKSRGNTLLPDSYVRQYGSDIFRLYLGFAFAYIEGGPWSDNGIKSIARFAARIERQTEEVTQRLQAAGLDWHCALPLAECNTVTDADRSLNFVLNRSLKGVTFDLDRFQFNTSISRMMELSNELTDYLGEAHAEVNLPFLAHVQTTLIQMLAPFAPHLCEELWEQTGHTPSIFFTPWPVFDPQALVRDTVEIAVQLNGQVKHRMHVPTEATAEEVEALVRAEPHVQTVLQGRRILKFIYIKGRLANLVVPK